MPTPRRLCKGSRRGHLFDRTDDQRDMTYGTVDDMSGDDHINYNRFAVQSLSRLAALSDGLFAIAMTLLVLNLVVPGVGTVKSEGDLGQALLKLGPHLLTYVLSFMTLGIFWVGQQAQLNRFDKINRDLAWIHIAFLAVVSLLPFTTALLAAFITYRLAVVVYWFNILLCGLTLLWSWRYALHATLTDEATTDELSTAIQRRIVYAQVLYAVGMSLCLVNTYLSIVAIILVQLNYAAAPRIRFLYNL